MTRALSVDLRRRVTDAIAQGKSRRAAAEQFATASKKSCMFVKLRG